MTLQTVKNYAQAAPLMDKITSPKLHQLYGQAMESYRKYYEAERAYLIAKDLDGVVRLNLEYLGNPQKVLFNTL